MIVRYKWPSLGVWKDNGKHWLFENKFEVIVMMVSIQFNPADPSPVMMSYAVLYVGDTL